MSGFYILYVTSNSRSKIEITSWVLYLSLIVLLRLHAGYISMLLVGTSSRVILFKIVCPLYYNIHHKYCHQCSIWIQELQSLLQLWFLPCIWRVDLVSVRAVTWRFGFSRVLLKQTWLNIYSPQLIIIFYINSGKREAAVHVVSHC